MSFMDAWPYRYKIRLAIGGVVLFCMSACSTYTESRYAAFGKTTLATVTKAQSNDGRRGRTWSLTYEFDDNGNKRIEEDYGEERYDMSGVVGQPIPVQYIPGSVGNSRLAGSGSKLMMIPFFAALVVGGFVGWGFMQEYREVERKRG